MNERIELTDDLLVRALRQRTDVPIPATLLSGIMAGATGLPQERPARRLLPWAPGPGRRLSIPMPAIAGAAIGVAILIAAVALRPVPNTPAASPTTAPTPTGAPTSRPTPGTPTAEPQLLGSATALRLRLGNDVAPIDVISAFDSIWTADIHANDVRRFDPATMREIARVPVPGGPAWFVVADGALWVSTQNGLGLTRIDPATNTVAATVGNDPPCAAPFLLDGEIWQGACDGDVFLQIDPRTNAVIKRHPAAAHGFLVHADAGFFTSGNDGLARWDPASETFTKLAKYTGPTGALMFSDGPSLWVIGGSAVLRVDPADGHTLASFPYPGVIAATFDGGRALLTSSTAGIIEVDLATNAVLRTTPVPGPWVAHAVNGVLWATDFNNSILWRIEP
jgi:DNA-binding beta-propeller fold protein YncE